MTPYELKVYCEAYAENKKLESEEKLMIAYATSLWTSRWVWAKKVPELNKILKQNKKIDPVDTLEQLKKYNTALGGSTY